MSNEISVFKEILNKTKEYNKIIIVRHIRPDGDCMGSSIGLREILKVNFPDKTVVSLGCNTYSYLNFLGLEDNYDDYNEEFYKDALIIAVDTATKDRIDNKNVSYGKEIIKIDHHINIEEYGNINYVEEENPATCCIITDFAFSNNLIISKEAAMALYVGITTDTGRFRYRGVCSKTLEMSSILLKNDLDLEYIYSKLYLKDVNMLYLQGEVLKKFKTTKNKVAYIRIDKKMQDKFEMSVDEAANVVNLLDSIKEVIVWIAFIDQEDGSIRVRLRSRFVSIVSIANKYHGGGHERACGATVYSLEELKSLLKDADSLVKSFKETNTGWL